MRRILVLLTVTVLFACNRSKSEVKEKKPNIILIMADDMGFSDLGFMGSGIQTPNIDRLANNGMVFNQFYNAGRCCPTRASLITGLYAHNADLGWMTASDYGRPGYRGAISKNSVTLAQVLKRAGYQNYVTGKWHVTYDRNMVAGADNSNWPLQRGFDKYYGVLSGGGGYYIPTTLTEGNERLKPNKDFYLTEAINTSTVDILEEHFRTKKDDPFFFYVAHYAPHRPLHALEVDINKYKGKFTKGWDYFRDQRFKTMTQSGLTNAWLLSERPDNIPAWNSLSEEEKAMWEMRMEVYAAQIDRMDQGIGQILNLLEANNELDNTVIMFLSDNGGNAEPQGKDFEAETIENSGNNDFNQSYRRNWANMSNTPFRLYKSSNHEGGISTPLVVHWPAKIKKGTITNQKGHVIDFMPTFLELAETSYPEELNGNKIKPYQGKSLLSAIEGKSKEREALFFEHQADRAVIDGKWKLVSTKANKKPFKGKWELYDLSVDRAEEHSLIEQYPEIAKILEQEWNTWSMDNNVLPLDGRGWNQRLRSDINYDEK
ncbi:arylsulfatase [Algibacter mikhailovii]|uniref:Arylsulfatase n=1 Tax=Algibacter mikhailovii TaxID=425498 RepID=A0A918R5I1_9FLAO|nr:arylsulfatase [Algibacter mikhailovii]GGZ87428.1 arylsulfatase [Algibacter mikhailovii]